MPSNVSFRLPDHVITAVDAEAMRESLAQPGRKVTRTDLLREAIFARFAVAVLQSGANPIRDSSARVRHRAAT